MCCAESLWTLLSDSGNFHPNPQTQRTQIHTHVRTHTDTLFVFCDLFTQTMRFPAFYLNCYRYIFQFLILTITPIWLSLSISTPNPIFNLKNLSLFGDPQNVPITVSPQNMSSLVSYTRTHTHNEVSWSRISRYYHVFHYFSLKAKTSRSQTGTDTLAVVTVGIERFNAFFFLHKYLLHFEARFKYLQKPKVCAVGKYIFCSSQTWGLCRCSPQLGQCFHCTVKYT